jgi:hypothetical protein
VTEPICYPTDEDASAALVEDVDPDPEVEDAPSDPQDPSADPAEPLNPA